MLLNSIRMAGMSVLSVCLLAGCAAPKWDESQCRNANWFALGQRQGAAAAPFDIEKVQRQCQKDYQVMINRSQYDRGYDDGLKNQFCTRDHGLAMGKGGYDYQGVCQAVGRDKTFRIAWIKGLREWCVPLVIKDYAASGNDFPSWCRFVSGVNMAELQVAYNEGQNIANQKAVIQSNIGRLESQIRTVSWDLAKAEKAGNRREASRLQTRLSNLESQLAEAKRRLYENPN